MFTCTGSEAVDLALRVARFFTGGEGTVITADAYHGVTTAAAEISPSLGPAVPLGRAVWTVAPPAAQETVHSLAERVQETIADMNRHGVRLAAFIADSLVSSDGIHPARCLKPVLGAVHEAGGLYIADEVQPGFGRTGEAMWGFQRHGIVPDLAVIGKPMGNGMPIAGVAARPEILTPGPAPEPSAPRPSPGSNRNDRYARAGGEGRRFVCSFGGQGTRDCRQMRAAGLPGPRPRRPSRPAARLA